METADKHPLVKFGESRGWDYLRTARFFRVPYGSFKQLVNGHTGASYKRAAAWEKRSKGAVLVIDVLAWHASHRREAQASDGASAA